MTWTTAPITAALTAPAVSPDALPGHPLFVFAAYFAVVLLSVGLPFAVSLVLYELLQLWVARRRDRAEIDIRPLLLAVLVTVALGVVGMLLLQFGLTGDPPVSDTAASLGGLAQRLLIVFVPLTVLVLVLRALIARRR